MTASKSSQDIQARLREVFFKQALPYAVSPTVCNRFHIFPTEIEGFCTVVFGGAVLHTPGGQTDSTAEGEAIARIEASLMMHKTLAIDIMNLFEKYYSITEEDRRNRAALVNRVEGASNG